MPHRVSGSLLAALGSGIILAALVLATGGASAHHPADRDRGGSAARPLRPNIVFVLADDLSMDLLPYMPHVRAMQARGLTFDNYFVSDSLCCPSRASILTGNFPHDTGIFENDGPHGGFDEFHRRHEERRTFAVALQRSGYRTALMGKYMNRYMGAPGEPVVAAAETYVPPGWTEWDGVGWGYPEFDYVVNDDGNLQRYGQQPSDYLTDVLAGKAVDFIGRSASMGRPFFLEVAPFAPHAPYTPAPRNAGDFPGLNSPRPPGFNALPSDPPRWLAHRSRLTAAQVALIDRVYRSRAQAVEAVDAMVGRISQALDAAGVAGNTYLVFSSDNGLHAGQHRLLPGKLTAFDSDIHVPLIVTGPGVAPHSRTHAMAQNIDLAETFASIAGTSVRADGHSLLALLRGARPRHWRNAALIEHRHPQPGEAGPDSPPPDSGDPPTYEALRTPRVLYVEYRDGEREFYDLRADPFELHNLASRLSLARRERLHAALRGLERCHSRRVCWTAAHLRHT